MNIKNMLGAATLNKEEEKSLIPLYTPWGEKLDAMNILSGYPRPQMRRDNYVMLNGLWEYKIETAVAGKDVRTETAAETETVAGTETAAETETVAETETAAETGKGAETEKRAEAGKEFIPDGRILVPFSPESRLSGVLRQLQPGEQLWYQRRVKLEKPEAAGGRCILHFEAVDYEAEVYVNGGLVTTHRGGYLPFEADITDDIFKNQSSGGECQDRRFADILLQVCVRDDSDASFHSRGKQKRKSGGIFYTAQSGIWQSVWYEWVPDDYIRSLTITPDFDRKQVKIQLEHGRTVPMDDVRIMVSAPGLYLRNEEADGEAAKYTIREEKIPEITDPSCSADKISVKIRSANRDDAGRKNVRDTFIFELPENVPFSPWTPEHPYLYRLSVDAGMDHVESYFAMRMISAERDAKGILRFCLNHEPVFLNGVLDQGYWPDGLMTAPSEEAFVYDICLAKSLGFNMIRKHIKVEPLRWYYHCDRLGMIVWQDMVNGGTSYNIPLVSYLVTVLPFMGKHVSDSHYRLLSRKSREGREEWERECHDTVEHLKSVPSIAVWGLFNEGWGQFDSARITDHVRALDPTRLIDSASGWFDQGAGDFRSVHNYFRKLKAEKSPNRIFAITEYGGLSCLIKGHASTDSIFGYQKFDTTEALKNRFYEIRAEAEALISQGLSAVVYTQLSDIEEEVNGIVTYDRKIVKC